MIIYDDNFSAFSNCLSELIISTDKNGKIVFVNEAFEKTTGYPLSEVQGNLPSLLKSHRHSPALYTELWDTISRGEKFRKVLINKKKNGDIFYQDTTIMPVYTRSHEIVNYLSIGSDITKIVRYSDTIKIIQDEFKILKKDFDDLTYRFSHEIRGPVATINGLVNLAKFEITDDKFLGYCEMVKNQASRLDAIITNMLKLSLIRSNEKRNVPEMYLQDIVESVLRRLKKLYLIEKMKIETDLQTSAKIRFSPFLLRNIIRPILENAVRYRKPQHSLEEHTIRITAEIKNKKLIIKISDNGIGIPQNIRDKIFDIFFRGAEYENTMGLGLYLSANATRKLGGEIKVESTEGEGSTFKIFLPYPENV